MAAQYQQRLAFCRVSTAQARRHPNHIPNANRQRVARHQRRRSTHHHPQRRYRHQQPLFPMAAQRAVATPSAHQPNQRGRYPHSIQTHTSAAQKPAPRCAHQHQPAHQHRVRQPHHQQHHPRQKPHRNPAPSPSQLHLQPPRTPHQNRQPEKLLVQHPRRTRRQHRRPLRPIRRFGVRRRTGRHRRQQRAQPIGQPEQHQHQHRPSRQRHRLARQHPTAPVCQTH